LWFLPCLALDYSKSPKVRSTWQGTQASCQQSTQTCSPVSAPFWIDPPVLVKPSDDFRPWETPQARTTQLSCSKFLTHRNCVIINVNCLESLSLGVIYYTT
jgi:hypothetical protein